MSAVIVLLMECKYERADNRKWREHVRDDGAAHEMELRTHLESKEAGNTLAITMLHMKWKYTLPDSQKRRGHVSSDGAAYET